MESKLKFFMKSTIYSMYKTDKEEVYIVLEPDIEEIVVKAVKKEDSQKDHPEFNQKFNLYGENKQFVIQAMNGRYICYEDGRYVAKEMKKEQATIFTYTLEKYITHKTASNKEMYLGIVDGKLQSCSAEAAKSIGVKAQFDLNSITEGLEIIRQYGATARDLTWVDLSGEDFKQLPFMDAILDNATLSNCNLAECKFMGRNLSAQNTNFSNSNMQYTMMNQGNFKKADFSYANLTYASAIEADFAEANFDFGVLKAFNGIKGNFEKASCYKADCQYGQFREANFKGADLSSVNLEHGQLTNSCLENVNFSNAILREIDFSTCSVNKNTVFRAVEASNSSFRGLDLSDCYMAHANLKGSIFDDATMINIDLSYTNLEDASFRAETKDAVILRGATLAGANLKGADFTNAQLGLLESDKNSVAANLTGVYMPNAIFDYANLYGVNMSGVSWYTISQSGKNAETDSKGASAKNAKLQCINFSNANLAGMDFNQSDLSGCCFEYANLLFTNFQATRLGTVSGKNVSFSYANIQGANFFGSKIIDVTFTNAAVSINEGPYFNMQYSTTLLQELNQEGDVPQEIRKEFNAKGYDLDENAKVKMLYKDCSWEIKNSNNTQYPKYSVCLAKEVQDKEVKDVFKVSGPDIGVSLFKIENVSDEDIQGLNKGEVSENIKKAFKENGYTLIDEVTISKSIASYKWYLDNNAHDTSRIQTGYIQFVLLNTTENEINTLYAYGYQLSTLRINDDNVYTQELNFMVSTKWIQNLLSDKTICPNGQRASSLTDLRPATRISWEDAMRADILPQVPDYVPDPDPFHW